MQPTPISSGVMEGVNRPPPTRLEIVQEQRPEVEHVQRSNIEYCQYLFDTDKLFFKLTHPKKRHDRVVHVVGGGHSVNDTLDEIDGEICGINGSHDWLIGRGIVPDYAAFMDWTWTVADRMTPHKLVKYYCASTCHRYLFKKLQQYSPTVWHTTFAKDMAPPGSLFIGGGPSMTLRAMNLFYVLGFREIHLHGVDTCWRDDEPSHVYPWKSEGVSGQAPIEIEKFGRTFKTRLDWASQAQWFERILDAFKGYEEAGTMEPTKIVVHGDGLIPHIARIRGIHAHSVD